MQVLFFAVISMHNRRSVFRDNPDPNDPEFFEKIMAVIQQLESEGVHLELRGS